MYLNKSYILCKKKSLAYNIFIVLFIISFTLLLLFLYFYKIDNIKTIYGVYNNYTTIYIQPDDVMNLSDSDMYINDKKIDFQIVEIKDQIMLNNEIHHEVILNISLEEQYKITNNIINITLIKGETTFFNKMKGMIL